MRPGKCYKDARKKTLDSQGIHPGDPWVTVKFLQKCHMNKMIASIKGGRPLAVSSSPVFVMWASIQIVVFAYQQPLHRKYMQTIVEMCCVAAYMGL